MSSSRCSSIGPRSALEVSTSRQSNGRAIATAGQLLDSDRARVVVPFRYQLRRLEIEQRVACAGLPLAASTAAPVEPESGLGNGRCCHAVSLQSYRKSLLGRWL